MIIRLEKKVRKGSLERLERRSVGQLAVFYRGLAGEVQDSIGKAIFR